VIGSGGDTIWSHKHLPFSNNLTKTWARGIASISQLEFRLRVGFQSFSPVYIGARHNDAIQKIQTSEEMKPWSIGGSYDRPIPRRIAELAGVPREQFGIKKVASGHSTISKNKHFSKTSSTRYHNFRKKMKKQANPLKTFSYFLCYSVHFILEYRILKRNRRFKHSTPMQRKYTFILNNPPFKCPWEFCFTFHWMFHELKDRYSKK